MVSFFFGSLVSVCMELHRGYHGGLLGRGVVSSRIACNGVFLMICFLLLFIYGDTQVCFITITFWLFLLHASPKWFTPILVVCGMCMFFNSDGVGFLEGCCTSDCPSLCVPSSDSVWTVMFVFVGLKRIGISGLFLLLGVCFFTVSWMLEIVLLLCGLLLV